MNKKQEEIKTVDVCGKCFRNVWDCTCEHDSIEPEQFVTMSEFTAGIIYEMRKDEEKDGKK